MPANSAELDQNAPKCIILGLHCFRVKKGTQMKLLAWSHKHSKSKITLKAPIKTAADDNFYNIFLNFQKNNVCYFMRIVCWQTILMKYRALFVIFEKAAKFEIVVCCKLLVALYGLILHVFSEFLKSLPEHSITGHERSCSKKGADHAHLGIR